VFKSTPSQFQTVIFAINKPQNVGDLSVSKVTERQRQIIDIIKASPTISGREMSEMLSVSQRTIERDLSVLQKMKILRHEGMDNHGVWVLID